MIVPHDGIKVQKSWPRWLQLWAVLNAVISSAAILSILWLLPRLHMSRNGVLPKEHPVAHQTHGNYIPEDIAMYNYARYDAELGEPSVFKGAPRQELNEAWRDIVDHPMILVDEETLQANDPSSLPSKGIDGHFYATLEVYHQLHCLDITRKYIWRDHYQDVDTFQDPPSMVWEHVDHCIDLLRQVLMCHGDLGLIFYTDVGDRQPVARVSTGHTCRNMTAITSWVEAHDSELGRHAEDVIF